MQLSISIEGMCGLTWPRWQRLILVIEQLGFAGLFRSDHFTLDEPPDPDSLEAIVSLSYLASQSHRVHFGTMVAPLSFRDPILLARQAMALDDLSHGRMILGVGAGHDAREHTRFGYALGDTPTRMARLAEGLELITQLIRSPEPVTFAGRFYQTQNAQLVPRPHRATPLLVGGNGPKRTLPLVARYADIWNCQVATVQEFTERSAHLDALLHAQGRPLNAVKRTVLLPVLCWRSPDERERRMDFLRSIGALFARPTEELMGIYRTYMAGILGSPSEVTRQIQAYAKAGAEELIIQWFGVDDIEGLEILAAVLRPYLPS